MDLDKIKTFRDLQEKIRELKGKPQYEIERIALENQLLKLQIEDLESKPAATRNHILIGAAISLTSAILGAWLSNYLSESQSKDQLQKIYLVGDTVYKTSDSSFFFKR
jgi:hypothetical protein